MLRYYISFLFIGCFFVLFAQDDRYTEAEIDLQRRFIEAKAFRILGDTEKAYEKLEALKKDDPQNAEVFFQLAGVQFDNEAYIKAGESIERAIQLNDSQEPYWQLYAAIYDKLNRDDKAAFAYQKLQRIAPKEKHYGLKEAFYLVRMNQIDKAMAVYEGMQQRFGVDEEVVRRRHTLLLGQGKLKEAGQELVKLTEANPANISYLELLASFYEQAKDTKKAQKVYADILTLEPNHAKAQIALQGNNKTSGEEAYLESLQTTFQNPDGDLDAKIEVLFPYIRKVGVSKDPMLNSQTKKLAEILTQAHPDEAKAYAIQGDLAYHAADLEAASKSYEKTIELNPNVLSVWEQLMEVYFDMGDNDKLLHLSEDALYIYPSQASIFLKHGIALLYANRLDESLQIFSEAELMAARSKELSQEVASWKALALLKKGKKEQAKTTILAADKVKKSVLTTAIKAQILVETDGVSAAKSALKEVSSQFPKDKFVLYTQALIAKAEKNEDSFNEALNRLREQNGFLHLQAKQLEL